MAALKAYFDNSDSDTVVAFAGYISTVDKWKIFERDWASVLSEFNVPYLHMKEFGKEKLADAPHAYKELNEDHRRKAEFFSRLIEVLNENTVASISTCIRINDLDRFNIINSVDLNPHSIALYGCIMQMLGEFRDQHIEVIVDKIEKAHQKVGEAIDYAMTDGSHIKCEQLLQIDPLTADNSFKKILPMQAADFIAWELRKISKDRDEWYEVYYTGSNNWRANLKSMSEWAINHVERYGDFPRERKTFKRLLKTPRAVGFNWTYPELMDLHAMHPNGWYRD